MCEKNFVRKVEGKLNKSGDPSSFRWVMQGRSLTRSGIEVIHTKCVQGTFWEKWMVGSTPDGIYPVFVGSCMGGNFSGQAPELFTINVPEVLFGKCGRHVQHIR